MKVTEMGVRLHVRLMGVWVCECVGVGVVWCGMVWRGVVWRGVAWCGVEWCGVVCLCVYVY